MKLYKKLKQYIFRKSPFLRNLKVHLAVSLVMSVGYNHIQKSKKPLSAKPTSKRSHARKTSSIG